MPAPASLSQRTICDTDLSRVGPPLRDAWSSSRERPCPSMAQGRSLGQANGVAPFWRTLERFRS
jgi:hypothetical protein